MPHPEAMAARRGRIRREDDESAGDFLARVGTMGQDADPQRNSSFHSGAFKDEFLARLNKAEQRDTASLVLQQQVSAAALDDLLLEPAEADLARAGGSFKKKTAAQVAGEGEGEGSAAQSLDPVLPTSDEVSRLVGLFWKGAVNRRSHAADSSLYVEGSQSFVIPREQELDFPTFCKLIALVQRPASKGVGQKGVHSAQQRLGWEECFRAMDSDGAGTLTRQKIRRFVDRHNRAAEERQRQAAKNAERQRDRSALAEDLQLRLEQNVQQRRSRESGLAALEEAMRKGTPLEALFALVIALAPALFGCERATLWLVRPTRSAAQPPGDASHASSPDAFEEEARHAWDGSGPRELFTRLSSGGGDSSLWETSLMNAPAAAAGDDSSGVAVPEVADKANHGRFGENHDGESEAIIPVNKLSIIGSCVATQEAQMVADCRQDVRFDSSWDERTGFVTRTMMCLPLLDFRDLGTPLHPKLPMCVGALQLINKLPADVVPPAVFQYKDAHEGETFCEKLTGVIEVALPVMLEREARKAEKVQLRKKRRAAKRRHRVVDANALTNLNTNVVR